MASKLVSSNLRHGIEEVWQVIHSDLLGSSDDGVTNLEAVQCCGERLKVFGHPKAQEELESLIRRKGPDRAFALVSKAVGQLEGTK